MITDGVVWLAMVVSTTMLLETFIRARFRVSLGTLFGVTAVFAIVFSLYPVSRQVVGPNGYS